MRKELTKRMTSVVAGAALVCALTVTQVQPVQAEPITLTILTIKLLKLAAILGGFGAGISGLHDLQEMQEKRERREEPKPQVTKPRDHGHGYPYRGDDRLQDSTLHGDTMITGGRG